MRAVYLIILIMMLLFIGVQYNDADGAMWMLIYAIPAVWSAVAAFRHSVLGHAAVQWGLLACILLSVVGVFYYWPKTPGWWRQEIWWEVETAREGMGMMIIAIVLFIVWLGRPRSPRPNDAGG